MGNLLDINVSDIADSLEDELFIIDGKYRLRFANSAARQKHTKKGQGCSASGATMSSMPESHRARHRYGHVR